MHTGTKANAQVALFSSWLTRCLPMGKAGSSGLLGVTGIADFGSLTGLADHGLKSSTALVEGHRYDLMVRDS